MVRGRADRGDIVVHLAARQLASLPGFCSLHDLDLQLLGLGEILDRDPEASAGHLLDRGAAQAPVRIRDVARRVLAPLARIRLGADAVHGQGERLVGLPGDGAEAHGAGGEPLYDFGLGFDLVEICGRTPGNEFEKTAQRRLARILVVGVSGEAQVGVLRVAARGDPKAAHGGRIPHVTGPALAPVEVPGIGQRASVAARLARKPQLVAALDFLGQHAEADPAHAALGVGEAAVDHLRPQPDRLEDLRPLVGLQGRDPHLRHHLQDALADALPVAGHYVVVGTDMVVLVHLSVAPGAPQRLVGEVGVDGVRPVTQQQAVVVHLARFAGLHHKGDARALMRPNQVMVDAACGEQGAEGQAVRADRAVREHEQPISLLNGAVGLLLETAESAEQAPLPGAPREGGVQGSASPAAVLHVREGGELSVGEDRVGEPQPVRVLLGDLKEVPLGPDVAFERHDHFLADRIDGGVGHLRKALLEVVVQHARPIRQRRQLRVVAHRSERVAPVAHQAQQHELQCLGRIAEGLHALHHGGFVVTVRILFLAQFDPLPRQPFPVGPLPCPLRLDLVVRYQAPGIEVDQKEPPRM